MTDNFPKNKGYTLLFAIIVASVVLSIAAFILSVSRKDFILSSMARDSIYSIYAADSAMQCAVESYFITFIFRPSDQAVTSNYIICNGGIFSGNYIATENSSDPLATKYNLKAGTEGEESFQIHYLEEPIRIDLPNNTCAIVSIVQGYDQNTSEHKTIIESRGYNLANSYPCNPDASLNPRMVERATRLIYTD